MSAATIVAWATVLLLVTLFVRALPEAIRWARREHRAAREREQQALIAARRELAEIERRLMVQYHRDGPKGEG